MLIFYVLNLSRQDLTWETLIVLASNIKDIKDMQEGNQAYAYCSFYKKYYFHIRRIELRTRLLVLKPITPLDSTWFDSFNAVLEAAVSYLGSNIPVHFASFDDWKCWKVEDMLKKMGMVSMDRYTITKEVFTTYHRRCKLGGCPNAAAMAARRDGCLYIIPLSSRLNALEDRIRALEQNQK